MQPSPEAAAWGKRQVSRSPQWSDAKWKRVATIFQLTLTETALADVRHDECDQFDEQRDAA